MYKLLKQPSNCIIKINNLGEIICYIPNDPYNIDWLEYQAWLAADPKNQPLPVDE